MKRDQLAFLLGGLAFGALIGFGLFHALANQPGSSLPQAQGVIDGPRGPSAATQVPMGGSSGAPQAPAGAAPMIAEINALKKRLQDDPRDAKAAVRLANLYQDVRMFEQAIAFYQRALEVTPADPNVLTDKGICHEELGQYDDALALFKRAQAADPNHWQSLYNIVVVSGFYLDRAEEAQSALARLERLNPDAPNLAALREKLAGAQSGGTR